MIESVDGIVTGCERASMNLRTVQKVRKPILIVPPLTRLQIANVDERRYDAESIINVVMVGRLGRGKGAEVIVRLWPQLNLGPACLHLFGEFEDAELKARLEIATVNAACIKLHGRFELEDLPSILAQADLGLMLSIEEGYGLVVCEYMAAGLPFVMTDAGAAPEFTRNNPDGIMVDVDPRAIGDGIREMVDRMRRGLTSRSRLARHYAAAFAFDELASQHLAYFRDPKRFWVGFS
jgi:glycosyltransferase involved in cell wall biosynthesis